MGTHPIFESDFDCLTEKKMDYKVAVKTKKNLFAGTDAQVFCRLTDVNGVTTPTIWLKDETKKSFESGKKDDFSFTIREHTHLIKNVPLADLWKCQVWRNNDGTGADWDLATITFTNEENKKPYNFTFDRVIKKSTVEEQIVDGLTDEPKDYQVSVATSDRKNAGTDAKIMLNIMGNRGDTRFRALENKKFNNFARGKTDKFNINAFSVGDVEAIQLKMSKTITLASAWHVDHILITEGETETYFPVKMWLKEGQMFKISPRDKPVEKPQIDPPAPVDPTPVDPPAPVDPNGTDAPEVEAKTRLRGIVKTADKIGAGTDAKVDIWFTDINGQTSPAITMREEGGDTMEAGSSNNLEVALLNEFADIYKISVRQDGSGLGDNWDLEYIDLVPLDLTTGEPKDGKSPTRFFFKKTKKQRKIYESGNGLDPQEYEIKIKTSDEKHSGTDDNVYIDVIGTKGRTQKRKLSNKLRDDFERGRTDKFEIDAVDLGE